MNAWIIQPPDGIKSRNRRLGFGLVVLAVLYVVAVIAFIIMK
jgi:hypothetical protein